MKPEQKVLIFILAITAVAVSVALLIRQKNIYDAEKNYQQRFRSPVTIDSEPVRMVATSSESNIMTTSTYKSQDGVTMVNVSNLIQDGKIIIDNPSFFSGTTTVFENRINWKLTDNSYNVVAEGGAYVNSPDMGLPGAFAVTMYYKSSPKTKQGMLKIFESSAKDGSSIHVVNIPVEFKYTEAIGGGCESQVSIAFGNSKLDPEMLDCSKVFYVKRKICGSASQDDLLALNELLKGPDLLEKEAGYFSSLPVGVELPTVEFSKNGRKIWNFNSTLEKEIGGSCRVAAIRSQIIETIKANDIKLPDGEVIIAIDGRTEDILQP